MDPLILDVAVDVAFSRAFPEELLLTDVVGVPMPDRLADLLEPCYGRSVWGS